MIDEINKLNKTYKEEYIKKVERHENIKNNYISKQKIKNKIEELKKLIEKIKEDDQYSNEIPLYEHDIKLLEELLQEEDK